MLTQTPIFPRSYIIFLSCLLLNNGLFFLSLQVAVHFQEIVDTNDEGDENSFTVVDGSGFVVSRTVFRDNSSYYEIDGKRKQFKASQVFLFLLTVVDVFLFYFFIFRKSPPC